VHVAVGSTRAPKVEAVRRVLASLAPVVEPLRGASVTALDLGGIAPAMPLTLQELLDGSRLRAERVLERLLEQGEPADLGVGLEGGLDVRQHGPERRAFLMSWAYVTDGRRGAHGCGGAIELPASLLAEVVDRGRELGGAADAMAGEDDVRSRQGTWGVLTRGLVDRTRSFELALLNALAPFYNAERYA
jgi:non-canonical (house-cleaning) NTP pyrophosphatase